MKALIVFLAITGTCLAFSSFDTLTTKSGRIYQGVFVQKQEPDGLRITHAEGTAKILFTDLPDDILVFYDYNPEAAKAHQDKILNARIVAEKEKKIQAMLEEKGIQIEGRILQVHEKGLLLVDAVTAFLIFPDGTEHPASLAVMKEASKLEKSPNMREVKLSPGDLSSVFIECPPAGYVDNQKITQVVWPIGTYRYENTQGVARTIPKYTSQAALARAAYSEIQ
jgi:hypothetical protein